MTTSLNVLILEDRDADLRLVLHELKRAGFEPLARHADDEAGFVRHLEPAPEVIVADYYLPQYDALQALRLVRARDMDIPFIIVSGSIGEDIAVAAMKEGAADYLIKDRLARLGEAVRHAMEQKRLRDEKRRVEEALRQSEQSLREANRRKDEFLAMLAHELRNPLAPIVNSLHVLDQPHLHPQAAEQVRQMMQRQVRHLSRLVDDLLDVSRITRGKAQLRPERVDLVQLVRSTTEDHRKLIEAAGLSFTLDVESGPVWTTADPTRLAQVLGNLLHNAVKFTPKGGRVAVKLRVDASQQRAVVCVEDSGGGIEAALLPHLFEAFAQADQGMARTKGGLGLGLALVKGLVELHGGAVSAASAGLGHGAAFTFWLPLNDRPAAPRPQAPVIRSDRRLRILIIEDSRDTAESLRLVLELAGHEAEIAATGPSGVEAVHRLRPSVVLCDLGLPGGMNGYDVARALRQDPATANVHLIAVSGYGQPEDCARAIAAGFDLHLAKPVAPDDLQCILAGISTDR